jgi:hypothetical protein
MRFETLITNTLAEFAPLGCQPIAIPDNFARIERAEIDGVLIMQTEFMAVEGKGELRFVHIYSPKINVLTFFFFPAARWQLPVYCMELVIFNVQPIVAMLDCLCLKPMPIAQTIKQLLSDAHQNQPLLAQASDIPDWFAQCRSGDDFFIRPQDEAELNALSALHLELLKPITHLIQHATEFEHNEEAVHQQKLLEYKQHHREHAPGLRLMNRSFGEQWTSDYMNYFFQ